MPMMPYSHCQPASRSTEIVPRDSVALNPMPSIALLQFHFAIPPVQLFWALFREFESEKWSVGRIRGLQLDGLGR